MDELPKLRLDLCPAPALEDDDDDESVEVSSYNGLTLCEGNVLGVLDDISTDDEDKSIDCNNTIDIESVAPLPIDIKSDEYDLSPTDQQIINNNNNLSSQRSNKSRSSYYKKRGREHVHIPILSSLSNRAISIIAGVALVIGLSIFVVAITTSLREPQQSSSVASSVLGDENTNSGEIDSLQGGGEEDSTYGYFDDEILTTLNTQKQSDGSFVSRDENNDCEFEPCLEEEEEEEEVAPVSSGGRQCDGTLLRIDIETDNYGFETSWTLQKRNPENNNRYEPLQLGPPLPTRYADNTKYIGVYCLSEPGRYKFTINDLFKDGMCCEFGEGSYIGYLDGVEAFSSPEDGTEEWEVRSHPFTIDAKEVEEEENVLGGGQQAPEELAICSSNDECSVNQDGKDFCNNEVCGYCTIGTTRDDDERPACVDQGNGIAVYGCEDSSCGSGKTCGSPSCVADINNFCSNDHDAVYEC